jgi:hypothetical protein
MEDLLAGLAAKDIALKTHEVHYEHWLAEARNAAFRFAQTNGFVCSDDVHRLCPMPSWVHHNAMGAVFRDNRFVRRGYVQSKRPSAHARVISDYVLRGD